MNVLPFDYTQGVLLCESRLHVVDPDAPALDSGRRCYACRVASRRRAQAAWRKRQRRRRRSR